MRFISFVFLCCWCSSLTYAAEPIQRIASMSLCSDELILQLADRSAIASLSYLSADPAYSGHSSDIDGIPLNHGQAEEIIALDPDLILTSRFSATSAVNLLQQFSYSVHTLDFPVTMEQSYRQINEVAELVGEPERGAALIAQMQARIAGIQLRLAAYRDKSAVFYSNNGFSFGSSTLRDSFLVSLGLNNLAAANGLVGVGRLPLELLIAAEPDILLVDQAGPHDSKLAQALLQHPALQRFPSPPTVVVLPDRLFQCAGPALLDAYDIMLDALESSE